jgi:hypothetical protein
MTKRKLLSILLILAAMFLFAGCDDDSDDPNNTNAGLDNTADETGAGGGLSDPDTDTGADSGADAGGIEGWLRQVNNGELPLRNEGQTLDYGLGYFVYYTSIETAIDTLIYNALVVHDQMATGDASEGSLAQNQQNLVDFTEGVQYDPEVDATEQIVQTEEIRDSILGRVVESQSDLTPEEALDSNEVIGFVALNAQEDIGRKYLVYTQESPDADFQFLGVVLAVDADGQTAGSSETYSFQGWQDLPLLGDASGPFWENLPAGVSGDPANTDEGRPGVLLISESTYQEIQ